MRRLTALFLMPALAAGALAFDDPSGDPPAEVPPSPIEYTFHLHGTDTIDETAHGVLDPFAPMDFTPPTGTVPKSKQMLNYVGGPNTVCSGNNLFPTWIGNITGTMQGSVQVSIPAVGTGGLVDVSIFADSQGLNCNSGTTQNYIPPLATARVAAPTGPGTITATLPVDASRARTDFSLTVMIAPAPGAAGLGSPTAQARVLYDATGFAATVKVTCLPEDEPGVEDETCEI
jgi:hypothetical protein